MLVTLLVRTFFELGDLSVLLEPQCLDGFGCCFDLLCCLFLRLDEELVKVAAVALQFPNRLFGLLKALDGLCFLLLDNLADFARLLSRIDVHLCLQLEVGDVQPRQEVSRLLAHLLERLHVGGELLLQPLLRGREVGVHSLDLAARNCQ